MITVRGSATRFFKNAKPSLWLFFVSIWVAGCLHPEAPGSAVIREMHPLLEGQAEWLELSQAQEADIRRPRILREETRRNLLLVISDDVVQRQFGAEFRKIYKDPAVRLEDALWWAYAPKIQRVYKSVLRIFWNGFTRETLADALRIMESRGESYDVFLLVHGIPNHLMASPGFGMISWQEIADLKGRLHHARLLYLQACYGASMAKDFLMTGFREVVAFRGLHWNFFFPGYFLDALSRSPADPMLAYQSVADHFENRFLNNTVDRFTVKKLLKQNPKTFVESIELPRLFRISRP